MTRAVIAIPMLLTLALIAVAFGPSPAPRVPVAAARDNAPDRISVVRGGVATPLQPQDKIALVRDIDAVVSVTAAEGVRFTRTLDVTIAEPAGAVDGAAVRVTAHMRYMDHGSFVAAASPRGAGGYVATLPFAMPGEWELTIECRLGADSGTIVLDIDIGP